MNDGLMNGVFPDEDMATCGQCGHEFIVFAPEMTREEVEQATPEYCAQWHQEL